MSGDRDVRWDRLTHAYGVATEVPEWLASLERAYASGQGVEQAWAPIESALMHQGSVYEATVAALPFLGSIGERFPTARARVVSFVGSCLAGSGPHARESTPEIRQSAEKAAEWCVPVIKSLRTSDDLEELLPDLLSVYAFLMPAGVGDTLGVAIPRIAEGEVEIEGECQACSSWLRVFFSNERRQLFSANTPDGIDRTPEAKEITAMLAAAARKPAANPRSVGAEERLVSCVGWSSGNPRLARAIVVTFAPVRCAVCGSLARPDGWRAV